MDENPVDDTTKDLDARGLMCPEPLVLAQRALDSLPAGRLLRVHTTDPAAPIDFEVWCLRRGHQLLECVAEDGGHVITIAGSA